MLKSISVLDIIFSMLFSLHLANKANILCLFFFLPIVFKNILTIPFQIRNTRVILVLSIPTGVPMTGETLLLAPGETKIVLST